jgi:uncharacterized protein (TIGR03118 family)
VGHGSLAKRHHLGQRQWYRCFYPLRARRHGAFTGGDDPDGRSKPGSRKSYWSSLQWYAVFPGDKKRKLGPALFIFVSEDGSISGWNPNVDPTNAIIAVDNGRNRGRNSAIYKGATLGVANGHNFLYVTDFHTGKAETYDESFHKVNPGGFVDPNLPAHYAPFGIRNFNGEIFVTYALQDHAREDDVPGPGHGFVNVFDTSGNFLRRLVSNGNLNSPWGLALVEGELWVGNFGDGLINNYDPNTGTFIETLMRADGTPLQFDGLWDLLPLGDGVFFTAGIADEEHGLFGIITED